MDCTRISIRREFLGWDAPALPVAAQRLATSYSEDTSLDLSKVIVVVPGQRAGRRLLELLAFLSEEQNLLLTPPTVVPQGRLAEMLYTPKLPFATEVVQDLAWTQALRELPVKERDRVVPHPPADALGWLNLGQVFRRLHVELAADGLSFEAVCKTGPKISDFDESERWQALVALQNRYHALLDKQQLWDIQTARLKAIEFREIQSDCDIILLGTADLNNTLRQMLEQVAERVTAYVIAPERLADRFDSYGCLIPAAWRDEHVPLSDEQLVQADGPEDQADAVSQWLAKIGKRFGSDEIAIGVPDEALVPQLQRQLAQCGVKPRWVEGVRISETSPYRLLRAAAHFADGRRYDDLASLLRHPDVESWLSPKASALVAQLDKFYNRRLPSRIIDVPTNDEHWPDLPRAVKAINKWLKDAFEPQPLRAWGSIFAEVLSVILASRSLNLADPADEALHSVLCGMLEECDHLTAIPTALDHEPLSAREAFKVALGPLGETFLPPPADPEAVEILGWLELPLDDSQAVIVTSFNEGFVPQSSGADGFLPDRLRKELQVMHNERRYARDAHATAVLCHGRQELQVVIARRDVRKDPLQPSRLIFACPPDVMIRRAQRLFGEREAVPKRSRMLLATTPPRAKSLFGIPRPKPPSRKIEQISVTRFKSYLACPYRYYLRFVEKLEAVDDSLRELDGGMFGSLMHRVLSAFGRDKQVRNSGKVQTILEYLMEELDRSIKRDFGADPGRPAIRLQLEQARRRLRTFAQRQAELIGDGWQVVFAEEDSREQLSAPFAVDSEPVMLTGKIDRIDFHEATGVVRVLDYKTAADGEHPHVTHRNADDWIDLQLPLYRHLWPKAPVSLRKVRRVELGYFNLPKRIQDTGVATATWDDEMLAGADDKAREVIRKLRQGMFLDPSPPPDYDDFAAICLANSISGPQIMDEDFGQ